MRLTRRQIGLGTLASLAPRLSRADDTLPFMFTHGRIAVTGRVNGTGPFAMFVDTGATSGVIAARLANQLALSSIGRGVSQYGDDFEFVQATLTLGDAITLTDTPISVLDTPDLLGDPYFQVLVPASLLTAADSLIDFDALIITRFTTSAPERSGYIPLSSNFGPAGAMVAPRPYSEITIGPNSVHALWDTGSPTTMEIPRAAGDRLGLWDDTKPYAPQRFAHVGGDDAGISRVIRAGPISIGPVSFESALILLRANGEEESVLGLALIATVNILFDAAARRLWIARNHQPPLSLGYNLSGVSLTSGDNQLIVADVGTGSPAFAAGLRRGDIVLNPATMDDADRLLDAPAGAGIGLTIQREAGPVLITFTLAPYL